MLLFCCLPARITGRYGAFRYQPAFRRLSVNVVFNSLFCFAVPIGIIMGKPLADAAAYRMISRKWFEQSYSSVISNVICAGLFIIIFAISFTVIGENMIDKGMPVPVPKRTENFAASALPKSLLITAFTLLLSKYGSFYRLYKIITAPGTKILSAGSGENFIVLLIAISTVLFLITYCIAIIQREKCKFS